MKYNLSYLGIRKQKAQFINNNNYLTIHFGDNSKNIKINYNIKDNESLNKTILSNKSGVYLNKNDMNDFKSYINKFGKNKSNTPFHNISYKSGESDNFQKQFFSNDELRRTKDIFFRVKDKSTINKNGRKKLNRNRSAYNVKRNDLNIFNKYYRFNNASINQNNNQANIINYFKNINKPNRNPINNKFVKNYHQNLNQYINYEKNIKNQYQRNTLDEESTQSISRNRQGFLSLNPLYKASRKKINFNSINNLNKSNSNLCINNSYLKLKCKSIDIERSVRNSYKNKIQLISPQNKDLILKENKTPIFKIKKNLLKKGDLSLNKKIKLSTVSTREYKKKKVDKATEINKSLNEKDLKINKEDIEVKEIKDIIKAYNVITHPGRDKNFLTKINQDYYVIEININGIKNFNLFGVLDGHGLYGHLISLFVGRYIVETFINHKEIKSCKDLDELYFKVKYNNFGIINDLFVNAEKELYKEEFDSNFSGTTCIIVFQIGENLICANSGDSRAILIYNEKERLLLNNNENNNTTSNNNKSPDKDINYYQIKNIIEPFSSFGKNFKSLFKRISSLSSKDIKRLRRFTQKITLIKKPNNFQKSDTRIFNLSNDLKPILPLEKKRILENGGRVEQYIEADGEINSPFRVWVQDEMYPGLAMSRSIGDFIASSVGVIPNPEIIEYNLNKSSKYMVIASDGIWQFMSNEKVMDIGNKYYPKKDPFDLCNELLREANVCWNKERIPTDDITVIVVYF